MDGKIQKLVNLARGNSNQHEQEVCYFKIGKIICNGSSLSDDNVDTNKDLLLKEIRKSEYLARKNHELHLKVMEMTEKIELAEKQKDSYWNECSENVNETVTVQEIKSCSVIPYVVAIGEAVLLLGIVFCKLL